MLYKEVTFMNIAIVGAGKLGRKLSQILLKGNHAITLIDTNEDRLEKLSNQMDVMTVVGDAKEISFLKDLDIEAFDYFITTTQEDELNILVASFAKKLGASHTIARVRTPEYMQQFDFIRETMNIDFLMNPDLTITNEIFKFLMQHNTLQNGIFSTGHISLIEFKAKKIKQLINLNLAEINSVLTDMLVVAISRKGKIIIPRGNDTILEDDTIYVIGHKDAILELDKKVHEYEQHNHIKKAMIIGGGKTGFYLAKKLADTGTNVKIIERDVKRCRYLAEKLENVMILQGDGTDKNMLEDENIDAMDAVITATGFDEDNLLLALMANQYNISHIIAKISRDSYSDFISELGIVTMNPLDLIASNISKIISGKHKILFNQLLQGQAEITELIATNHMKITNKSLSSVKLPHGVIIAAVQRGDEVIIPHGNTVIKNKDKVLVISLLSALSSMAELTRA